MRITRLYYTINYPILQALFSNLTKNIRPHKPFRPLRLFTTVKLPGRNWDTGDFYFIPADLSGIREIEADPTFPLDFYESSSRLTDQVTGDAYYSIFNGHGFELYSEDGDRLTTLQQSWATIYDGRIFEADDELFCTYRSLDGELLFRFPMYSGAD